MIRRPPRSTRTDTLFPYTTLFRSIFDCYLAKMTVRDFTNPNLPTTPAEVVHPAAIPMMDYNPYAYTRSEEHTSELQSLMRISYAVFCLKIKKQNFMYSKSLVKPSYSLQQTKHNNK